MLNSVQALVEMLIADLPVKFISGLIERTPLVYQEAFSRSYEEPTWEEEEAYYILGHNRRVIFESMFRAEAVKAGLAVDVKDNGRNCPYTLVRAGRFILTASHAHSQNDIIQRAIFRNQHAGVNRLLINPLLPIPELDPARLSEADSIYILLLHGEEFKNPRQLGFMRVAFPSAGTESYVENLCLFKLHQEMLVRSNAIPQEEPIIDLAQPRIKKKLG
jgi:hypothetical protein